MSTDETTLRDQQAKWVRQWRAASVPLAEQHAFELRTMTREQAWQAIEALLSLELSIPISEARERYSGLVDLQRFLQRLRRS